MLQSIVDFTISNSHCHLFYKESSGTIYSKSYYNKTKKSFYVNGDVYLDQKGR